MDVNECVVMPDICGFDKTCVNTDGGYECNCRSGYQKASTDNSVPCTDINECDVQSLNNCTTTTSTCQNTGGGYTCKCKSGYQQKNAYECEDIDECTTGSNDCEQECVNFEGRYNCKCKFGFELETDRKTCKKVSDPCGSLSNLTCSYACKLAGNTTSCYCKSGYELDTDNKTCEDIDECTADATNLCSIKTNCTNIAGSFQCSCPAGKFLQNDQRTCTDCDQFHWGDSCKNSCDCGPGASSCNPVTGCVCMSGWEGDKCDDDVDECNVNNTCDTANNQKCVNTAGSYICQCVTGYQNESGNCTNIVECGTNSPCDQLCTDTPGSYTCACRAGFIIDANQKCQDINECDLSLSKCDQNCINTLGSYKCYCNDGYQLDKSDLRTCTDIDECLVPSTNNCTTHASCHDTDGGFYCVCNTAYEGVGDVNCTLAVPTTTYAPAQGEYSVRVVLTIDITVTFNLTNTNTPNYKMLLTETSIALKKYYSSQVSLQSIFIKVILYSIKVGSLIADHAVVSNQTNSQHNVIAAADKLVNGGATVTILGTSYVVTSASIASDGKTAVVTKSTTPCRSFNQVVTCPTNQGCAINSTNNVPYCAPLQSPDNFELIVGLGVGIPLFFIIVGLIIVLCVYNNKRKKSKDMEDDIDRTMPADQGLFTGAIPGRCNSWNKQSAYPFNDRCDEISLDSDRGAYNNEKYRGKDAYVYDNNRSGKPDNFSWDFIFQGLPTNGQYRIKRPEIKIKSKDPTQF